MLPPKTRSRNIVKFGPAKAPVRYCAISRAAILAALFLQFRPSFLGFARPGSVGRKSLRIYPPRSLRKTSTVSDRRKSQLGGIFQRSDPDEERDTEHARPHQHISHQRSFPPLPDPLPSQQRVSHVYHACISGPQPTRRKWHERTSRACLPLASFKELTAKHAGKPCSNGFVPRENSR